MKRNNSFAILSAGIFSMLMFSCENQPIEFPDYEYTTVYFAYQSPVRTIVLGEDIFDNTLDNEHKCKIYATMGGVYENNERIDIDIALDNSLCSNLTFADGSPVQAMPSNYYSLTSNQITLDMTMLGGVEVELSDAFFADSLSVLNTYVIPLKMTNVTNADSILSGSPKFSGAVKGNIADWDILPKDYVLYCVKYINPYHANYLRRGRDVISGSGLDSVIIRHAEYVEYDQVSSMKTVTMNAVELPVSVLDASKTNVTCNLLLTFNDQGECSVSTNSIGFTASGSGSFVVDGDKDSWGNMDRNVIYLDYTINLAGRTYESNDTLVVRDRDVSIETFTPVYVEE
jgi:hypothetical protein